jgi:integrase
MGRRSTTGGVRAAGDRIEFRFTWQGKELRPTRDKKPTAAALAQAARDRAAIVAEIAHGTFSLERWFPDYRFRTKHEPDAPERSRTFDDWCDTWLALSARSLEHSTLAIYKRHLAAYWRSVWGSLPAATITHRMVLERLGELAQERFDEMTGKASPPLSRKTQNNILIPLRSVFALICRPPSTLPDPTAGIDNLKVQKPGPDPFSAEEVEVVLDQLRRTEGEEMADWFEFAFFAGLRTSEQIALRWQHVDLRSGTVLIREARVMAKDKGRTKTNVERIVELNSRAASVLQRQRARTQLQAHGCVFATAGKPDKAWHDEQVQWRAWQRALRLCGVRYRAPKEARDTSVTMALQAGASPVWVANQHGHSVTVMLKDYAKWIPQADRGRNLAAVNQALQDQTPGDSAVQAQ